jgi:Zn-finger nucleic acid-binding protein
MRCLECNTDMDEEVHFGVVLDRCPSCRALWFDYDEINRYLESHPEARHDAESHGDVEAFLMTQCRETGECCPKCGRGSLEAGEVGEDLKLQLQRCAFFCGFFLTRDQFDRFLRLSVPEPESKHENGEQNLGVLAARASGRVATEAAGELLAEGMVRGFWYVVLSILTPG